MFQQGQRSALSASAARWPITRLAARIGPWLLFAAFLAWGWRTTDLSHTVPAYGDVLEGLWALTWHADALQLGLSPVRSPLLFHPVGWYMATYAWGPAVLALLVPLHTAGGAAFAYNVATLLTFLIAFAGAYTLGQRFDWIFSDLCIRKHLQWTNSRSDAKECA